ncbi:MAG TPA: hypothetical protein VKF37_02670 [Chloroflexota bacterium]|nr:hypothetical protein [Chloroflexota bacterium]
MQQRTAIAERAEPVAHAYHREAGDYFRDTARIVVADDGDTVLIYNCNDAKSWADITV